jgi:branched-chain amino acid transport system ATP-binding protein
MSSGLIITGLETGYGRNVVVHDVNLTVAAGEVVCLLGANGAGKTTTLLAAVGQLPQLHGRVTVDGYVISDRHPSRGARCGLAFVPDNRGLFLQLTVAENLRLVHPWRMSLDKVLERFPAIAPLLNRRAGLLSGGEQQMVALAKAVLFVPKVLLIDEMSHGLAPLIAARLLTTVRQLANDHGTAVLLVEQTVDLALSASDRGYVMRQGRIVMDGPADEIRERREVLEAHYLGADAQRPTAVAGS